MRQRKACGKGCDNGDSMKSSQATEAVVDARAQWLAAAREAIQIESVALANAASRLDESLIRAVDLIHDHAGKVVVMGAGKSGHVARKLAATLCSTGTPAVSIHPGEATHGDLGVYEDGDPTILISNSGATEELLRVVPLLREIGSPLIGILGSVRSPLASEMDVVLDGTVRREADPQRIVPTSSTIVAMALGDALTVALMCARGFSPEDFHLRHPGGMLGRSLKLTVTEVMHAGDKVAWVQPSDAMKLVVVAMSRRPLGAACVVSPDRTLVGLITDGDLRRALEAHDDIRTLCAADIMTTDPIVITPNETLRQALHLMEDRTSEISVLPVVDQNGGKAAGLLRLHDLCSPDLAGA